MSTLDSCQLLTAKSIFGLKIVDQTFNEIGEIKDVIIDPVRGNIICAMLTIRGFLGFNEKSSLAIPWSALLFDSTKTKHAILKVPIQKLEQAPGLSIDLQPSSEQWDLVDKVYDYYGFEPYSHRTPLA